MATPSPFTMFWRRCHRLHYVGDHHVATPLLFTTSEVTLFPADARDDRNRLAPHNCTTHLHHILARTFFCIVGFQVWIAPGHKPNSAHGARSGVDCTLQAPRVPNKRRAPFMRKRFQRRHHLLEPQTISHAEDQSINTLFTLTSTLQTPNKINHPPA